MKQFHSFSEQQTEKIACEIAKLLKKNDIIAFKGGLGAGKTSFVRGLAKGLELRDDVSSPTFAIVNEYRGEIPLYHFDMYKINSIEDLYSTGFFDYIDTDGIIAVEWSENISAALPDKHITVEIEHSGQDERNIIISGDERF